MKRGPLKVLLLIVWCLTSFLLFLPISFAASREASPFTLKTLSSEEISLSQLKGSPVILIFFSTNCPFCKLEMPILQKLYEEYSLKADLKVLGIVAKDKPEKIKSLVSSLGVTYPILVDESGKVFMEYLVMGVPTTFFVNPQGEVADLVIGATSEKILRDKLNSILWYRGLKEIEIQNLLKLSERVTVLDARRNPSNPFPEKTEYLSLDSSKLKLSELDRSKLYLVLAESNQKGLNLCKEMALQGFKRVYFMLHAE